MNPRDNLLNLSRRRGQFQAYPWPEFDKADWSFLPRAVAAIQACGLAAQVWMECTIWETAWYLRRMDLLMLDMAAEEETAVFLLDKLTDLGSPEQVRATVHRHLELAGPRGGLFCCPTHMLEPEVPWQNIEAYVAACREWNP